MNWVNWMGLLCVTILLVATMAQATHVCAFQFGDVQGTPQVRTGVWSSPTCLICLMATSISLVAFFVFISLGRAKVARIRCSQPRPCLFLDAFHLYVRPPPTCSSSFCF